MMMTQLTCNRLLRSRFLRTGIQTVSVFALAVSLSQNSAFAWSKLERIEFKPSSTVTEISLRSESILPYRITHSSDTKLTIDFNDVATNDTIDTRFEGISEIASISNVVIQPLNDHSIRLIIRGEHLAPPHIDFKPLQTIENTQPIARESKPNLISESFGESIENPSQADSLPEAKPEQNTDNQPIVHQAPQKPQALAQGQKGMANDMNEASLTPMALAEVKRPETNNWLENFQGDPLGLLTSKLGAFNIENLAQIGAAGLLLLGLGWFIRKKVQQLALAKANNGQFEYLLTQQAQGKAVGFHQLAKAYPGSGELEPTPELKQSKQHEKQSNSVIGLRGLSQMIQPGVIPLEQRLQQERAAQQNNLPTLAKQQAPKAPIRQAINQYAQANKPALASRPQRPEAVVGPKGNATNTPDSKLRQEIKQVTETKQQLRQELYSQMAQSGNGSSSILANAKQSPLQRQALQQRQVSQAGAGAVKNMPGQPNPKSPLPGNPEVLSFLRDVADLMEKDGRPGMADSFRKNLNPS